MKKLSILLWLLPLVYIIPQYCKGQIGIQKCICIQSGINDLFVILEKDSRVEKDSLLMIINNNFFPEECLVGFDRYKIKAVYLPNLNGDSVLFYRKLIHGFMDFPYEYRQGICIYKYVENEEELLLKVVMLSTNAVFEIKFNYMFQKCVYSVTEVGQF